MRPAAVLSTGHACPPQGSSAGSDRKPRATWRKWQELPSYSEGPRGSLHAVSVTLKMGFLTTEPNHRASSSYICILVSGREGSGKDVPQKRPPHLLSHPNGPAFASPSPRPEGRPGNALFQGVMCPTRVERQRAAPFTAGSDRKPDPEAGCSTSRSVSAQTTRRWACEDRPARHVTLPRSEARKWCLESKESQHIVPTDGRVWLC